MLIQGDKGGKVRDLPQKAFDVVGALVGTAVLKTASSADPQDGLQYEVHQAAKYYLAHSATEPKPAWKTCYRNVPYIKTCVYQHVGNKKRYWVLGVARIWRMQGWYVLYSSEEEGDSQLYLRPYDNFRERFAFLDA
jgi:hypothetical protein